MIKEETDLVILDDLHKGNHNRALNLGVDDTSQNSKTEKVPDGFLSRCQEDVSNDKLKSVGGKILVTLGLILGTFIGSTSETAVSTITEAIGQDLETFGSLTWIAGGYLLTLVAFTPLFGKLSDIFGRKPVELFNIALFAIGSLGCALANSMTLLIIFRAIAGIGGGGIISMSLVMVSDVIPIENRSNYLSLISATYVIAQIVGPILGGVLAEVSWRITFYIMLPLCVILAILVIFIMDLPKSEGNILKKVKRVDFLGSITLILAIVALILATNWGGKDYAWNSVPIIILFVLMAIFFIAFVVIELRVSPEPVLPSRIFVRNVVLALTASFMSGGAQFIAIFYIPIYYQNVHGSSPSESSYRLFPFLAIISICCISSSYLIKIFNTVRGVMWAGGVITIIGTCLVAFMRQNSTLAEQIIFVLIYGIGLGLIFQLVIFVCTLSVSPNDVAIVSGLFTFSVNIGGVISLAIVGTVYNNVLVAQISENLPFFDPKELIDSRIVSTLSRENQEILKTCYHFAFRYAFICMIPFAILLLVSVLGLTKLEIPGKIISQSEH
jgi:multidrug resistance protein